MGSYESNPTLYLQHLQVSERCIIKDSAVAFAHLLGCNGRDPRQAGYFSTAYSAPMRGEAVTVEIHATHLAIVILQNHDTRYSVSMSRSGNTRAVIPVRLAPSRVRIGLRCMEMLYCYGENDVLVMAVRRSDIDLARENN